MGKVFSNGRLFLFNRKSQKSRKRLFPFCVPEHVKLPPETNIKSPDLLRGHLKGTCVYNFILFRTFLFYTPVF